MQTKQRMNTTISSDDLEKLLQLSTRDDLILFSLGYAKGNKRFGDDLRAFLGKKYLCNAKTTSQYVRQMAKAFGATRDIGDSWHSYEVTDWSAVFTKAYEIVKEGRKLLGLGNADAAATIAVEFFKLLCKDFDQNEADLYEDEDMDCQFECGQAEELLLDALSHPNVSKGLKWRIVAEVNALSNRDVSDYDLVDLDDLKLSVTMMSLSDEDRLVLLDGQIASHKDCGDQHVYVERKVALLRQMDRDADADKEEQRYIHLPEIRKIVVDRLVEQRQYDKAIECAKGGIGADNGRKVSFADFTWMERVLKIYELQGDKPSQIKAARDLFVSTHGGAEYYHKLKALIPKGEWREWLRQLIADTPFTYLDGYGQSNLADIYVEEGEKEKLYELIKTQAEYNTTTLDYYARYTDSSHAEELLSLYTEVLKSMAEGGANRNKYPHIAKSMECMGLLEGGKEAAHKLAVFFREKYRRRTSMMAAIEKF